ncbi:MAG TPA: uracil-DNA glycosylase [Casimicrobiaceae bacterium]|jgi:uracil-DNA glycosylase family 4|nr:uracil-DNA glycosylase [Casimicrobiaceae bacterium]
MFHETKKAEIVPDGLPSPTYDAACRRCVRLATFLDEVKADHPAYRCLPVAPYGDPAARLVIVGLAPGLHGANATGRPFTGDYAGILLYETLHAYGYASSPLSRTAEDPLSLDDCRITNAVKCLPPANKPLPGEIRNCNDYLTADLAMLPEGGAVLALGRIAHDAALLALGLRRNHFVFAHGARHPLTHRRALFDSYHCSRYNTNTGRLTAGMFRDVFDAIADHLGRVRA